MAKFSEVSDFENIVALLDVLLSKLIQQIS